MKEYKRIRELREDKDLTQEKMARKLNITQRTYSRYENADSMLPLDILVKLADIHDVSTDYLLERTNIRKRYPRDNETEQK